MFHLSVAHYPNAGSSTVLYEAVAGANSKLP